MDRRGLRLHSPTTARRPARSDRQRAVRAPRRSWSTRSSTGATTAPPHPVARDDRLRDPRQGPHHAPPRRARGAARHLLGPGQPPVIEHLKQPRRHRGRAHAGAPVHPRPPAARARPAQLLGLQLDRLPRAAQRLRQLRPAGPAGAGVQADGEDPARRRHRGDPRRRLQPHRRGQRPGPDAVASRASTTRPTTGSTRRPAPLRRLHRHRQQPEHAPPARAAADHGQPALLGERDARRRLPLRPGRHPRPRAARRRQALVVLRPHPAGPGRQPGEADRRAVGRRRGRLPGRQLPAAVVGVERQVPRRGPRLLAGRRPHRRRVRLPLHRQLRPLRVHRAHARRPASTSSPPTTGSPLADLVSYDDKHNEANGEDNRDGTDDNRSWNCGVEGPTDDAEILALRAPPAAQPPRAPCSCPRACRCCSAATRSAAPSGGNNNAYAQDNEISWFDWDARRHRPARVHAPADAACAATTPCSGAASGSRAGRSWASGPTTSSGSPPRARP